MAQYRIFKDDGKLNLTYYCSASGDNPKNAINNALKEVINSKHHKGHWVAIPSDQLLIKNKFTV